MCELRLAVDGMGRAARETGYIDVSTFGKPGEAAAHVLTKGWLVAVDGRLRVPRSGSRTARRRHDYGSSARSSSSPPRARRGLGAQQPVEAAA